ncbi:retinol dehydrogenase 13, partial [Caerostris extrusa]
MITEEIGLWVILCTAVSVVKSWETTLDYMNIERRSSWPVGTSKGQKRAAEYVRKQVPEANITVMKLDLTAFASIRSFAEELLATQPHIHYLINNAAVGACPKWKTNDGFELQFGVNYLGHFLLTNLLMERIKASAPARIINLGSIAHI